MWRKVEGHFSRRREGVRVVRAFIELGLRVGRDGRPYLGDVRVSDAALARALGVDRRVVRSVCQQILRDQELRAVFMKLKPIGASLEAVASELGYTVLTIYADPHQPGVLAGVAGALAEKGLVVRQALADDPDLVPEPKLTLIVDGQVPADVLAKIHSLPQVKALKLSK
jgi:predicted regulator of amino acid metabolism with ACT domain